MLYLPPRYAHDGIAEGECITYSIGFRIPNRGELAREVLQRLSDDAEDVVGVSLYRDPNQSAVSQPSEIPPQMLEFAQDALRGALQDPDALGRALGEYMTEPKASVWFDANEAATHQDSQSIRLDRRTQMMFATRHIFINGES